MAFTRKWRALVILIKRALLLQTENCVCDTKVHTHERLEQNSKKNCTKIRSDVASNAYLILHEYNISNNNAD
uniref:Secreted protein n=1 Tax=Solanum tuberosum TaxID=4113 RepID=M1C9X2_SOLTU